MGKPKAPKPPDPAETAAAQTGTNVSTAVANAYLNNVNQITPDGSLSFDATGEYDFEDPASGATYKIPTFTATQTLSPQQQAIKTQTDAAELNLAGLSNSQSARLDSLLSQPVNLNNEATEARLFELGRKRLDPALERDREGLRTQLVNQGVRMGTEAYDREMSRFDEGRNDAYNQLLLGGRGQAVQETLAERNQPINEITALLSGSQVSQPNFVGTSQQQIPTTDYAGLVNSNYGQQMNQWGQQNQNRNQIIGGLFGLGAAGIRAY